MDPIALAKDRFVRQWQSFWAPRPHHVRRGPPALRLTMHASARKDGLRALRWLEWQPDNRCPFVIVETPCTTAAAFTQAVAGQLQRDLAVLREGLEDDGLKLASVAPCAASIDGLFAAPIDGTALRRLLVRAGEAVAGVLTGLVVIFAPARVDDPAAYGRWISELVPASNGASLRLAAIDVAGSQLDAALPDEARFEVDEAALLAFLRRLGSGDGAVPRDARPASVRDPRDTADAALGRKIASVDAGASLRRLLLDAAMAMKDGAFRHAVRKLRAARMLSRSIGLLEEASAVSIALGSAAFAAGDIGAALAAFGDGKALALSGGHRTLAAQAAMGEASVRLASARFAEAYDAYGEAMRLGESMPALAQDAARARDECRLRHVDATAAEGSSST